MAWEAIDNESALAVPADGVRVLARNVGVENQRGKKVIRIFLGKDLGVKLASYPFCDILVGTEADHGKLAVRFRKEGGQFKPSRNKQSTSIVIGVKSLEGLFSTSFETFDRAGLRLTTDGQSAVFAFDCPDDFWCADED